MKTTKGPYHINATGRYQARFKKLIGKQEYQELSIDEAIAFEKQLAEQRISKAVRKLDQNFPDKPEHMKRWLDEANKHEQIVLMLEKLKMLEKTK